MLAREVEARMLERLQYIKLEPGRILDAGCGDGHGAKRLAERYPGAQVLALDFALPMLQAARSQDPWLRRVLKVGGLLMFSCYGPDTLKELRNAFAARDAAPHVHGFVDMHDLGDMLSVCGYSAPVMDMEVITLTYADAEALLADLRATGQQNVLAERRRGLTGKGVLEGMRAAYEQLRRDGRLPASFEIVYGHAWKAQPRLTEDGRAIVTMHAPRAKGA